LGQRFCRKQEPKAARPEGVAVGATHPPRQAQTEGGVPYAALVSVSVEVGVASLDRRDKEKTDSARPPAPREKSMDIRREQNTDKKNLYP